MRLIADDVVSGLRGPEKPTLQRILAEAVPDRAWSCIAANLRFSIQPIKTESAVSSLVPVHADREHADLGASNCHIWSNCLGMLNLTRKLNPPKRTTPAAEEGTAAHEVAHMCILSHQDAIEMVDRVFNNIVVTDRMAHGVQQYLDLCRSFMTPDAECFTERKFNLKKLKPPAPMFGTSDFSAVIRSQRKVIIVDYKNGYIPVAAKALQLRYYVLGVLCSLPEDTPIEDIDVYIVQPNGGRGQPRIKPATYKIAEIFSWHLELMEKARATQDPDAPLTAGEWCKFCPNSGLCKVQAEFAMETAQLEFSADVPPGSPAVVEWSPPDVNGMTPDQLGALLVKFPRVRDFMDSVAATAKALAIEGVNIPHNKLVGGLGDRKWIAPLDTGKQLTRQYGLTEDQLWEKKLASPATVEKLLRPILRELGIKGKRADEMLEQALGLLTTRSPTAPRLVLDTDPTPALPARGDEFTAEPMPPEAMKP